MKIIEKRALRKRQNEEFNKSKAEDALKVSFNTGYISIQFDRLIFNHILLLTEAKYCALVQSDFVLFKVLLS